ncbi:MAG: hypothetical protein WAT79_06445 [Saprospiraceae bacterium]
MIVRIFLMIMFLSFLGCKPHYVKYGSKPLTEEANNYWNTGEAEITSYELTQARYGELRNGQAVMVFVTEPFSPKTFTKADKYRRSNVQVLKLNFTKNFTTGIYPYSMMTSTFYPMDGSSSSLKISSTSQEWCGHTYMDMRNRGFLEFETRSYFDGENTKEKVNPSFVEDDVWSMIKLFPNNLPTGNFKMVPSLFYLRLLHVETKGYECQITLQKEKEVAVYTMIYPGLNRTLSIRFERHFPFSILSWEESYPDGFGPDKKMLKTTGKKLKTLRSAYWQQNQNIHLPLRDSLGLI